MAQGNNQNRFGGPYMIQDSDHMSGIPAVSEGNERNSARQSEQSQSAGLQQGDQHGSGDQSASGQQGGERMRRFR